jgi:hypothetical protein
MALDANQLIIFQIIVVILCIFSLLLTIFTTIGFTRFMARKSKVSLYYALSNFTFLLSTTITNIGMIDAITEGYKTDLYHWGLLGMNIGIILASFFLYMFYAEMTNTKNIKRNFVLISTIFIIIFESLPQNNWFVDNTSGFQLKYISYLFQTLYCVAIYFTGARGFRYLASRVEEQKSDILKIMWGNIILACFFVLMLLRSMITEGFFLYFIQIGSWILQFTALILFFMGYIIPGFRNQEQKPNKLNKQEGK